MNAAAVNLSLIFLTFAALALWMLIVVRRHRPRVDPLPGGGLRFRPVWLASPQHIARVEALLRSAPGGNLARLDVPASMPAITIGAQRFPMLFEAVGTLDVVGARAVFSPDASFLRGGNYSNIRQDISFEFAIPTAVRLQTVESPVSARFSSDWVCLSGLDIDPVMMCVGTKSLSSKASREMTRRLGDLLQAERRTEGSV